MICKDPKHTSNLCERYLESKEAEVWVMKHPTRSVELLLDELDQKVRKKVKDRRVSISATSSKDENILHLVHIFL